MDLGHSNETNIRQRRGDVVIAIKKFAYRGSLLGQIHPDSQRAGFDQRLAPNVCRARYRWALSAPIYKRRVTPHFTRRCRFFIGP